jgi:hypothetical protein
MTPYGISKEKLIEECHVSLKIHIYRLWDEKYYSCKFLGGGTTVDFQLYVKTIASLDARLRSLSFPEICRTCCPYRTKLRSTEVRAGQDH